MVDIKKNKRGEYLEVEKRTEKMFMVVKFDSHYLVKVNLDMNSILWPGT